jgi:hypothetical protein
MTIRFATSILMLCTAFTAAVTSAQSKTDSPEAVIRAMVMAMYANDVAAYNRVTLPHPLRERLTTGGRVNQSKLDQLKEDPSSLQIKARRPPLFRGEEAKADGSGTYPVGTTALYSVAHGGGPMIVPLVRREEGWKVDLRWWIAMMELATGGEPAPGSPDRAIRSLLAAMLSLDRSAAARFAVPGADMSVLFDGAPRQREPSGVLDAAVFEMPLVEIAPGEFGVRANGKVVEGSAAPDRKVLVGLFGPIEIPFVVRHVEAAWRVEADPFFMLMLQ